MISSPAVPFACAADGRRTGRTAAASASSRARSSLPSAASTIAESVSSTVASSQSPSAEHPSSPRRRGPMALSSCLRRAKATAPIPQSPCISTTNPQMPISTQNAAKAAESASGQTQFLNVVTRDEATAKFREHLRLHPLGKEVVPLREALHRVLTDDILAEVDVPGFDRSNVDGFAVQARDTFGAMEEKPRTARLNSEVLAPGIVPDKTVS